MENKLNAHIVFFDGYCNLCNSSVDFLISRDRQHKLYFASLQGRTAQELLPRANIEALTSIQVLKADGSLLTESHAIFFLLTQIETPLRALRVFLFLPQAITDLAYKLVAKNRYRLFGQRDTCRLPSSDERQFFLP